MSILHLLGYDHYVAGALLLTIHCLIGVMMLGGPCAAVCVLLDYRKGVIASVTAAMAAAVASMVVLPFYTAQLLYFFHTHPNLVVQ